MNMTQWTIAGLCLVFSACTTVKTTEPDGTVTEVTSIDPAGAALISEGIQAGKEVAIAKQPNADK